MLYIDVGAVRVIDRFRREGEAQMSFEQNDVRANRDYFVHKLRAEKQRNDVLHAVESSHFDFVLIDTRGREAFANGHIPGAWCIPASDLDQFVSQLPKDQEIVTYCWGHD
jgi:3-mercaptopyruvate sulfurtransferase SseA